MSSKLIENKSQPIIFAHPHNSLKVSNYSRSRELSNLLEGKTHRSLLPIMSAASKIDLTTSVTSDSRAIYNQIARSRNSVVSDLYEEAGQASDLVVAWKERQKSLDMITEAARTLVRTARAVKRRDPRLVRAVLRKNPEAKDLIKTPSGLWLGYHFGIVPTIHDIHSAANLFSQEFPVKPFDFSSRFTFSHSWSSDEGWDVNGYGFTKSGGVLTAVSPHVNLAQRLGFGQPLSVAWEMTPFSWFVDYFINVGELITNLEPRFPGMTFKGQYTSTVTNYDALYRIRSWVNQGRPGGRQSGVQGRVFVRETKWPRYTLQLSSPLSLSAQRCSYVVSVLGQLLTSMKPR